jgi:hypothetical protein
MAYEKFEKVLRNVDKLLANPDVKANEVNQYLNAEGYTSTQFKSAAENYTKAKGTTANYGNIKAGIQGLTMGFGDEFEATVKSLLTKTPYEQNISALRFSKEEFERQKPMQALASEVGGSVPTALLGGYGAVNIASRIPQAANLMSKIPTTLKAFGGAAGAGGVSGAITGAGTASEGERQKGAIESAIMGTVLGPAALGGIKLGGSVLGTVVDKTGINTAVKNIVDATKDIPIVKSITGKTADYFNLGEDAIQRRADTKIIQALQRDNMSLSSIKETMDAIRKSGYKPETILEFGGKATKQLGETVAGYPGARAVAERMVEERKTGAANRILTDFQEAFKINADPVKLADDLINARNAAASPLYQKAYEKGALIGGKQIDQLMQDPAFKRAYDRANRLAQREVDAEGNIIGKALPELKEAGNVFDLETINFIKRGIDAEINYSKLPTSGLEKTEVDSIKKLRNVFMTNVDSQAPVEYKQARQAFSGPTQVFEAIEDGKKFFETDARQLRKIYDGLGASEKDGFAIGAYDAIRTKINSGNDGIDLVKRTFGAPEKRDQIKILIGEDAFNTLESQLKRESTMRSTDVRLLGSSQTQPRQVAQAEFEGATELVPQMGQKGIVRGGLDYLLRSATGPGQRSAETIAPELFSTNPAMQANMVQRLGLLDEYLKQQAIRQSVGAGVVGTTPSLLD